MSWNEEKVNKLKELWGKGNTASQNCYDNWWY